MLIVFFIIIHYISDASQPQADHELLILIRNFPIVQTVLWVFSHPCAKTTNIAKMQFELMSFEFSVHPIDDSPPITCRGCHVDPLFSLEFIY